jgi:uncharacterized protein
VPYAAVTRFYDPSVQFLLQFEAPPPAPPADVKPTPEAGDETAPPTAEDGSKIVSLDQFRKK